MIREAQFMFPELPLHRVCSLLGASRATYYRASLGPGGMGEEQALLRDAIERIVLAFPGYGYRRVTVQLQRDGWVINHKRVLRVMRAESLLCQLKRRWTRTTDSEHGLRVYPNLLKETITTGINQTWVADITYIRLPRDFAYLATLLDAFSRRVVGWYLSRRLDAQVAVAALEQALAGRHPKPGWLHHSDRGVQYACRDYVDCLESAGARISMCAKGAPRENAQAESFFRTLKHEEVYLQDYQTYEEAKSSISRFIDDVYNHKRLHSSLGYRPPSEFEALLAVTQM